MRDENAAQVLTKGLLDELCGHLLREMEERNVKPDADAEDHPDSDGEK
jgi:hypothetical protein